MINDYHDNFVKLYLKGVKHSFHSEFCEGGCFGCFSMLRKFFFCVNKVGFITNYYMKLISGTCKGAVLNNNFFNIFFFKLVMLPWKNNNNTKPKKKH